MLYKISQMLHKKSVRLLLIAITIVAYIMLAIEDNVYTFSQHIQSIAFSLPIEVSLAVSLSIALIFLLVGSLVLLYARDGKVAFLLCAFCYTSMIPFELETAALVDTSGTTWITLFSDIAGEFAIFLLAVFLLTFPKNYFEASNLFSKNPEERKNTVALKRVIKTKLIYFYAIFLFLLFCLSSVHTFFAHFLLTTHFPGWLIIATTLSESIELMSSIITISISFRSSSSREREQLRFFTSGVILAFAPLLFLTILPSIIRFPAVSSQITTLSIILLPISLGYSILRYQLLVFDTYIRRTTKWLLGVLLLAILVYTTIIVGNEARISYLFTYVATAGVIAVLAPLLWWTAQIVTERVLFRESLHYRRLINEPIKLVDETLTLDDAAWLITVAAVQAFETLQACLFVFSEESGCYHLTPPLEEEQRDSGRHTLMKLLLHSSHLLNAIPALPDAIELLPAIETHLQFAHRPLLSYEVVRNPGDMPVGLERYFTSDALDKHGNLLFAPVRSQGKMIGLLVLGERGDQQSYAGPDFELVELLLARFAPTLETARLQQRSRQYTQMLNDLYHVNTISVHEAQTLESIATAYASVASTCLNVGVELWIYKDATQRELRSLTALGNGPRLATAQGISLELCQDDWVAVFHNGHTSHALKPDVRIPSCLPADTLMPFAWLPLKKKSGEYMGVLVLTYNRPHQFLKDEIHLLEMFAEQCAASLENTSIAIELRIAYERQKELDILKDQFITTASHELRTPLTAVLGYLELLAQYHTMLDQQTRDSFIEKAHRGCDELMLMVNNIMDANQMQFTIDKTKMETVPLREAIVYIVEMLDAVARSENRQVIVTIPDALAVKANTIRLHQILLNLLGNAFKYSPPGTPIEIDAVVQGDMVQTSIRDYGPGIPREEQLRLFERFMRLERDMNSPVRGTGLGLYICKQLVTAMDGAIWVVSSGQQGEGSRFIFTLHHAACSTPQASQSISLHH